MFYAYYANLVIVSSENKSNVSYYTKYYFSLFKIDIDKYLERFLGI